MTIKQFSYIATFTLYWVLSISSQVIAQTVNLELPNSKISMTLDGTGRWGINDGTAGQLGFMYNGEDLLKNTTTGRNEAGLMLGLSTTRISDVVKETNTARSTDFALQGNITTGNTAGDFKEYVAKYQESGVANPLGLQVTQKLYGWNTTTDQGFVVIEYRIKNVTSDTIKQLSLGIFSDWNLGTITENRANWDASNQLGYVYEAAGAGRHAGIALLTAQTPQYYAFDQDGGDGSLNINDGFSKAEKYQSMSGNLARTQAGVNGNGNDVAHTVAARLITLAPGQTSIVAFAIVAGASLNELQTRVQAAANRFRMHHASPTPTLPTDLKVCGPIGETTINPTGGSQFRFYDQVPTIGTTVPIAEGSSLRVENIQANRTIYVTNIDSLYEGSYSSITVRYVYPKAIIEDGLRELCVNGNLTLQAATGSPTASYQWQRDGQNVGNNSTDLLINQAGIYRVIVTEEGCSRTSAPVTVANIVHPIIAQSGTTLNAEALNAQTYQWFYNDLPLNGAINPAYIPRAPGTYTVRVGFGNGCAVVSSPFNVEVTGVATQHKLMGVKLYPIPSAGELTLELPPNIGHGVQLSLADLSGTIHYKAYLTINHKQKHVFTLPQHLPNGIYFVKLAARQKEAMIQLLIQK
ncbi:T9SS type A sorting domain-containing protein [uncultured Microscilla sp.]|uniref:T9SS type A sorting domain-containing protein n=1 Tax=uncultured Microscilla sp. TaxID=432653 RepID=UPI00263379B2|nr:T9SS type A sorting domain-containing protein [uncultured Microscilla sp.]